MDTITTPQVQEYVYASSGRVFSRSACCIFSPADAPGEVWIYAGSSNWDIHVLEDGHLIGDYIRTEYRS